MLSKKCMFWCFIHYWTLLVFASLSGELLETEYPTWISPKKHTWMNVTACPWRDSMEYKNILICDMMSNTAVEDWGLLRCYAVSHDKYLPNFWRSLKSSSLRSSSSRLGFLHLITLKLNLIPLFFDFMFVDTV